MNIFFGILSKVQSNFFVQTMIKNFDKVSVDLVFRNFLEGTLTHSYYRPVADPQGGAGAGVVGRVGAGYTDFCSQSKLFRFRAVFSKI